MRTSFMLNRCRSFATWIGVMQMKRAGARTSALLVIGIWLGGVTLGMAKNTKDAGMGACVGWCLDHNKTAHSVDICVANCDKYYPKKNEGATKNQEPVKSGSGSGQTINPNPGLQREPEGTSKKK
jgi:hypothetical protein